VIQATWVLTQYNVFGLADPLAELQFAGRSADNQHLFFDQLHAGLPVFPGGVAVHLDGDTAIGLSGGVASVANLAPEPALGQAQAEQQALAASPAGLEIIGDTLLTYLDTGLLGAPDGGVFLAWEVNLGAGAGCGGNGLCRCRDRGRGLSPAPRLRQPGSRPGRRQLSNQVPNSAASLRMTTSAATTCRRTAPTPAGT
jgi:hypothetical protein